MYNILWCRRISDTSPNSWKYRFSVVW